MSEAELPKRYEPAGFAAGQRKGEDGRAVAKVGVEGSNPFARSNFLQANESERSFGIGWPPPA